MVVGYPSRQLGGQSMTLILPPIFERTRERDERVHRYAVSAAGRASKKRAYQKRRLSEVLESEATRERIRANAEQRERFLAYRAANPPPRNVSD